MTASARYRGALIDLWGTLVPAGSRSARAPHLHAMAERLGVDPPLFESDWAESLGDRCVGALGPVEETVRRLAQRQGREPTAEAIAEAVEIRLAFSRPALAAEECVLDSLDALRAAGLELAVVSDCTDETVRLWPTTALASRFRATVFSSETGFCKPDPRSYRRAMQGLGLPSNECAYVGDGGSGELTGAERVGLDAFLYRAPGQRAEPEYRFLPDTEWQGPVLGDLRDLLAVRATAPRPKRTAVR